MLFSGLDETTDPDPQDHIVGTRLLTPALQFPWAKSAVFVVDVLRNSGDGDLHVTLTDIDLVDLADIILPLEASPVDSIVQATVDVTSAVIGKTTELTLAVFTYALDTSGMGALYAAIRFQS